MNFWDKIIWNNSINDWIISLLFIIGAFVVCYIFRIVGKRLKHITEKTESQLDDLLLQVFETPFLCGIMLLGIWIALARLNFTPEINTYIGKSYKVLIILNVTWFLERLGIAIVNQYVSPLAEKNETKIDIHIIKIINQTIQFLLWSIGIVLSINSMGVDVGALIAGLGIGGLAVALAAQDTVKNILGGVTIFVDKPFRFGDRININGIDGFVEDIGVRSTRLRTLEGRLVTIPNYKIVDGIIENITKEPSRKVIIQLGLTYDTTPEQMSLAMSILKNLPKEVTGITKETAVYFSNFGDSSLQIQFIYYIKKSKDIFDVQSQVNLAILNYFNANKLNFAFPTQTLYIQK
ncbi:MAG: mechanosensitive ion channel family protein [Sphingobacteriia bacterium]|nr:mechanosensitive ion channel family protein [Paludibacteraceae bacterium]NCA79302.1 mechanosensitive ion channel family protein [Sphingobacteriia bacterium]